jgi:uncharacterized protein YcbX
MRLSGLNIYPIKSLAGIGLAEAAIERRGLEFDRRWMLVDANNRFLTQREFPKMATLRIKVGEAALEITNETGGSLEVPFEPANATRATVEIWSSRCKAAIYGGEIDQWFSETLNTQCRLAKMPEATSRKVNFWYAVHKDDHVSFADGYPFLLIGQASLDDLNSRLAEPIPMNRFRPNFVVEGAESFAEDTWKKIRIGETVFHVVKPCARCVITTIDQATGTKTGKEPLKTLGDFRNRRGKLLFGQNLIAESGGGKIRIGDEVEVLETL